MLGTNSIYGVILAAGLGFGFYYFQKKRQNGDQILPKTWNTGATPYLNQYTVDFTSQALQQKIDPVIGREDEIRRLTQILSRRGKNNAILIGDPGVGKTAIVEGLAVKIAGNMVPEVLRNKRVLALDVAGLMSGTKYRGEFEERAKKIVNEITASSRSIILFIDEVHAIVESEGSEGALNLSDILKPALARGDLQMIGATTTLEYDKYIKSDASLERRFQPIEVFEPSPEEALIILKGVKDKYREYHKVEFTDAALATAVTLSTKLVHDRKLPDKAIDALDEAAAMVKVAYFHPAFSAILFKTASAAHPEASEMWKKIQEIDNKIVVSVTHDRRRLVTEREKLEEKLRSIGVVTVDSSDVEKIIKEWI